MVGPGMCPYCECRIGARKDGRRKKHYINETSFWSLSYALLECRGSSPQGAVPSYQTIREAKNRRGGKMKCLACQQWVGRKKTTFLPIKHYHDGKPCRGWRDNQN